jgi:hypothetical protein
MFFDALNSIWLTSMPGFTAASDTRVVSIQAPKTPVATTNEAANSENLRVIDLSC